MPLIHCHTPSGSSCSRALRGRERYKRNHERSSAVLGNAFRSELVAQAVRRLLCPNNAEELRQSDAAFQPQLFEPLILTRLPGEPPTNPHFGSHPGVQLTSIHSCGSSRHGHESACALSRVDAWSGTASMGVPFFAFQLTPRGVGRCHPPPL